MIVAGKGGTGRTTISAALSLVAAHHGKRVLSIDVDAKGDLARALGSRTASFSPRVVQKNISVLAFDPEESLLEYLGVYFKVPRATRLTPFARVLEFIATSVPGPRDLLTIGKIAYEERMRDRNGAPRWDIVIVDGPATGHLIPQLTAAREMLRLAPGGVMRGQIEWIEESLADHRRTALALCAIPEEMPVTEAIELHDRVRRQTAVAVAVCFLNRWLPFSLTSVQQRLAQEITGEAHCESVGSRLGGPPPAIRDAIFLAQKLHRKAEIHAAHLRTELKVPIVNVPLQSGNPGLATARGVASALETSDDAAAIAKKQARAG